MDKFTRSYIKTLFEHILDPDGNIIELRIAKLYTLQDFNQQSDIDYILSYCEQFQKTNRKVIKGDRSIAGRLLFLIRGGWKHEDCDTIDRIYIQACRDCHIELYLSIDVDNVSRLNLIKEY